MATENSFSFPFGDGKITFDTVTDKSLKQLEQAMTQGGRLIQARLNYWRLANDMGKQYHAEVVGLAATIKSWNESVDRAEVTEVNSEISMYHDEIGKRIASLTKLMSLWFSELMSPDAYDALEAFALFPKAPTDQPDTTDIQRAQETLRKAGLL